MTLIPRPLLDVFEPLSSAFLPLIVIMVIPFAFARFSTAWKRIAAIASVVALFFALYHISVRDVNTAEWLRAVNSPLFAVFLLVILPALYLPKGLIRRIFLIVPLSFVLFAIAAVLEGYASVPQGAEGFYWLLVKPSYFIAALVSLLVLIQPFLNLMWFRRAVRLSLFLVLIYGGFALRADYGDYAQMIQRRGSSTDTQLLMETTPVVRGERSLVYLPSAPCRFSSDGGYVQGCNVEMFQRLLMLDLSKVWSGDPGEVYAISVLFASVLILVVLLFLTARWTCGWLCPLSTMGDVLDWIRRKFRLPHLKVSRPVKIAAFTSGISLLGLTLIMAKLIPHLNDKGEIMGCKLPIYPFCKICPGQQVCPVAAQGLGGYPPLPTADWLFGFFKIACFVLLAFFLISFASGRRLWCRFCPMGMISGLFNRGGLFALTKNAQKCNQCGACAEVCPMDIDIVRSDMTLKDVGSYDCVLCLKCVEKCPRDGCLSLEHNGFKITESHFRG